MAYIPTIGDELDRLLDTIGKVNEHAHNLKACGLSVQMFVNGSDYGDRVSLRIEGMDLALRVPAAPTPGER